MRYPKDFRSFMIIKLPSQNKAATIPLALDGGIAAALFQYNLRFITAKLFDNSFYATLMVILIPKINSNSFKASFNFSFSTSSSTLIVAFGIECNDGTAIKL